MFLSANMGRIYLLFLLSASLISANVLPFNERCVTSVYTAYGSIPFTGAFSTGFYEKRCQNVLAVTSIYASSDFYCQPNERAAGFAQLEEQCEDLGLQLIPRERVAENLTGDAVSRMRSVDFRELPFDQPVDYPMLLSASHYDRVFRTTDTWAFEVWTHYAYGYIGYLYWACVLSIGIINRLLQHFLTSRYEDSLKSPSLLRYSPLRQTYHWFQTHFLVSTAIPSRGRQFLWWTFSSRSEASVTLGFGVLSIVLCCVGYRLFPENIYWPDLSAQLVRYMADRTGIVSFANLPLLWLFAGRNNICAWATGWNFATFNVFHRHVAWIATIQAVIHTALYLVLFFQNSNPWRKLQKPYLIWGTLATVLMVLILPAAVNWLRHRAYELFLIIHIVFSIGLLVGCFYHTIIFEGQEYWFYLWLPVGIWAFDRALRVIRILYCNLHVRTNSGRRLQYSKSTASYDKASDLIRLDVIPGSNTLRPRPGDYYFLYQPFRLTGWENHPFTLGCWSYKLGWKGSSPSTPRARKNDERIDITQVPLLSDDSASGTRSPALQKAKEGTEYRELKLTFWIRPYDGWTRSLRRQCLKNPDHTTNATMLLEGPYGHEFPLWTYDSVLLIAGGTGIASAVPYIHDHIARSSSSTVSSDQGDEPESDTPKTRISNMHLVWVTRQAAFINQFASPSGSGELVNALERDDFHASFYATFPHTQAAHRQQSAPVTPRISDIPTVPEADREIDILHGRPNLEKIIETFAEEAQLSNSSAAVLVCGPQRMADEARAVVHLAMKRGRAVRYVEESFTW
ncbi:ferric reductase family protein [Aspergillus stella-maris]|uniref:ferric reductase family protein n=1 Tax=Aspergillus stella-maris TaxID=1810926 RepID=UPI003CCE4A27